MGGDWREWSIFHVIFFLTFLVTGLLVNLIQFLVYILLVTVLGNRRLFRRFNYYCIYVIYGQLLFLADWWSQADITIYNKCPSLGQENALVIMNHHYELDWLYTWMAADRWSILGNSRVYVKKAIQYVPIIGWAWSLSDTLFLARDWSHDQKVLDKVLVDLQDFPSPVVILLFPEGTRFTKDKYLASREFAEKNGKPLLKHHLVPRIKGFTYTMSRIDKTKITAIYDLTLGCEMETAPTLTNALMGRKTKAHLVVNRIDINEVPEGDKEAAKWLSDLMVEKDETLDHFHRTGKFNVDVPGEIVPPRPWTLLLSFSLNTAMIVTLLTVMIKMGTISILIGGPIMVLASLGIKYFVNLTKVSKSSSYGSEKKKE